LATNQRRLLILAAGLFLAWIGWLAYLAITATRPIVLSRPQFLVSDLDVIAQVEETKTGVNHEATVKEVYWPLQGRPVSSGDKIVLTNLEGCTGWQGPGRYILALHHGTEGNEVVAPGKSPGFPPASPELGQTVARPRIYPVTSETIRQLEAIEAAKAAQPH
jgi:hypothetical protein